MKEEFKKTAVDSPSIKLARADFEFIKNEFETKTYLFDGSENNLEDDPVDNTVFLEKLNTSMLNLAVDEFAKKSLPRHVNLSLIYELKDLIAEGAQGSIHAAEDKHLGREVVVKKLKHNNLRRSFVKEAQLTAQLDHPSIIPVYSLNSDKNGNTYFSMKRVNGITLSEYLRRVCDHYYFNGFNVRNENTSLHTRLEHFIKICDAVQYAHYKGVIHRDLKPDNVMIGESREVYVMDWGIAYCKDDPENKKPEVLEQIRKTICGSPGYIDPQIVCDPIPNPHTDIYSLGMILHEICTLQRGFTGLNTNDLFEQAIKNDFPEIKHRFNKGIVLDELKSIITKARNPDVFLRYACVEELSEDIRRFLRNDEVSSLPDKPFRKFIRWSQKNPHKVTVIIMILISILSSIAIFSLVHQNKTISEAREREGQFAKFQNRVAEKAHTIDSQLSKLELLIGQLGEQLSKKPTDLDQNLKLYSSSDFDSKLSKPNGSIYSTIFSKVVNVSTPVYKLAPDTKYNQVKSSIEHLFSFKNQFLEIFLKSDLQGSHYLNTDQLNEDELFIKPLPVRWLYCGLENGVFISYPGKGGYPHDYDHRKRPWYIESKGQRGIRWVKPYYDINGLGLVLPCTVSLYHNDEFMGVLALDLTLDFLAKKLMFAKDESSASFLKESFILNSHGEIIVSSSMLVNNEKSRKINNQAIEPKLHPQKILTSAIEKGHDTVFSVAENNVKYVYAVNKISTLNWFYVEKCEAIKLSKINE